ncbi:ribokinase [Variovorax sp. J31P207]|uniref:ribokinase n=1 Tax=Variovorax sp. J31P207 TaxID=3053510 RepID=UPI0025757935|nr:ribokinase [Variovorax sp. J31P207]MDM0064945.1 ribokinase [Variovorax sp. J31P207]
MSRVFVLGNATVDQVHRVERLPAPGETVLASSIARCAGGKGLNQAVAAARTGARVTLAAPVGRDADAALLAQSLAGEAELEALWLAGDAPTDLSSIWVAEGGENVIVSSAGCARSITPEQARRLCDRLAPGDFLLLQGNLSAQATHAAAEAGRARGASCVLNTAPIAWDMHALLRLCDIVIANAGEAAILTAGAADVGQALRERGAGTGIVTLGPRGALITTEASQATIAAPQVETVDTAGAGDVFAGTLVGLLSTGHPLGLATQTAVAAASLSVTRRNTMPSFPTRSEIASLLERGRRPMPGSAHA